MASHEGTRLCHFAIPVVPHDLKRMVGGFCVIERGMAGRLEVSTDLFDLAVRSLFAREADVLLAANNGHEPGTSVHLGHPLGTAVALLWRDHRDQLMPFLAGFVDRLRLTSPVLETWRGPRIGLDDVLRGLPLVLPGWLPDDDVTSIIAAVATQLPQRLMADPNEP